MINKNYQRDYHRKWYIKNKVRRIELVIRNRKKIQKFISDYKVRVGCYDCGYDKHPEALDFDHVRGKKSFNLSQASVKGLGLEKIKIEIAKCEIVCAICHRIRSYNRRMAR